MIIQFVNILEEQLQKINFINFEIDLFVILLYMIICTPLGFVFHYIKSPTGRLYFNLFMGVFFSVIVCKEWFPLMLGWTIAVYFIAQIFKKCALPVSIVAFAILSFVHIYRLIYQYLSWRMDYNAIQMLLTARYIFYACDKQDGKVQGKTSFMMYLSYIFMFPNLVVAPIPYYAFVSLIERKTDYTHYSPKFALISFLKALAVSMAELLIRPYFDTDWYYSEEWRNQYSLWFKFAMTFLITPCARFTYIAAFYFTQAGMDAMGLTYNDKTKKNDLWLVFDYSFELEKNVVIKTQKWNCNIQNWLKYCFYDRLQKRFGSLTFYLVFMISSLWHGFYLSYYLFFIFWAITGQVYKYFYKAQRRFYFIPQSVRHFIAWVFGILTFDHFATAVRVLKWEKAIELHNSVYWIPHIVILVIFLFFNITQFGQKDGKPKDGKSKKQE
ncbi:unnamed protein product (macronuclear) [Paramecium tetraurelia]|uniref:Uncharacterized protein n=1 Tax=Paramecium tetraurelia TaxID=5888 RepID=A0BG02_PARTE|nr:uncharacterized protein GSPATT00028504001 [Paramecium tetraurelia]CAK57469.1 unnamed protein product [Paramecium tetraurelia]|eukprot:XP_001424867.1 hypothetical protein (macronuclear) [Paramecium tetraurelia strain d4-2]